MTKFGKGVNGLHAEKECKQLLNTLDKAVKHLPRLGKIQRYLLFEAVRRYTRFGKGKSLLTVWVGLGSATAYKSLLNAGLVEFVSGEHKGYTTWFKLTPKGAEYVQCWLDLGITHEDIEYLDRTLDY